jgi:hypothetical protein
VAFDNEAKRKIYFYRVVPHRPTDGWKFDRKAVVKAIESHAGRKSFYLDEGDDRISCAEVFDAKAPQSIKLYAIRRSNLPARDSGSGVIGDLGLKVSEGLAEAVHLRLFPNGIVGFESFYYGPRISRWESYLQERCSMAVSVRELYRGDMLDRALKFNDIRVLHVKLLPSMVTREQMKGAGLAGVLDAAKNFDAKVYADLTLRSERFDDGLTAKAKDLIRQFKRNKEDPSTVFAAFGIEGHNPETRRVDDLNLLNDALQRTVTIPRENARSRALDSPAAFAAIRVAYGQVKSDLPKDAHAS